MKKIISSIVLSAFVLTATPAFATNGHDNDRDDDDRGLRSSLNLKAKAGWGNVFNKHDKKHIPADRFSIVGTVTAASATGLTLTVEESINASTVVKGQSATVAVNADTKYFVRKDGPVALEDIKVGDRVVASGKLNGSVYLATHVWDLGIPTKKSYGKVTAKTDTSITIQNNQTGTSQTFTVDGDTKIAINGEVKTIADVAVGDAGMVKAKSNGTSLWAKILMLFR